MYGNVIQSVLTPDHTRLATLYRDPHSADHTAFVDLLDLTTGVTVCIDLAAPFGTGIADGTDAIRCATPTGPSTSATAPPGTSGGVTVAISPNAIFAGPPQRDYDADAHPDPAPPALPAGIAETPGFLRFVAIAS